MSYEPSSRAQAEPHRLNKFFLVPKSFLYNLSRRKERAQCPI